MSAGTASAAAAEDPFTTLVSVFPLLAPDERAAVVEIVVLLLARHASAGPSRSHRPLFRALTTLLLESPAASVSSLRLVRAQ